MPYAPTDLATVSLLGGRLDQAITDPKRQDPRLRWFKVARPDQRLPPMDNTWRVLLMTGGRGSGKTRAGAQNLAEMIQGDTDGDGEYGVIAPTYADAWTKCIEGESGLLRALGTNMSEIKDHKSKTVRSALRTYGQVVLHNGITVYIDSASEGGLRIQGRNLKAAWCDEIGLWDKWDLAWNESLRYAVRMGHSVIIATATPKASRPAAALMRSLLRDEEQHGGVIVRRLRTADNVRNLSDAFYRAVVGANKGTRLERQELEGELLDDVPNALWLRSQLEQIQVPPVGGEGGIPFLHRAVIGVDPSDGNENSDEQAYTIAGIGGDLLDTIYVAKNWGGQEAPAAFARRVLLEAVRWHARIVVEKNHGGAWLTTTFYQVAKDLTKSGAIPPGKVPQVQEIHASLAKRTRAEPVSALYERGVVRHCKMIDRDADGRPYPVAMVDLEDQMCIAQGELVTTARGGIPVEQVRAGDYALTRVGWRRVYRAGLTGLKPTVTIETGNSSVTCTGDHPVYVSGRGFTRADEVQSGDTLVSCRVPLSARSSSSTASGTTRTTTAITRPAAAVAAGCCTAISGRPSTGRSRPAGTSTTASAAGTATRSATWPLCPQETTTARTWLRKDRAVRSLTRSASAAPSAKRNGHDGDRASTRAPSAAESTSPAPTSRPATARASAATGLWADAVRSVRASGVRLVYDISVEGQPEFFAGGLLVHNCTFTGAQGERSPDRLDSLVWAVTPFLNASLMPDQQAVPKRWAFSEELDDLVPDTRPDGLGPGARRRLEGAHGGQLSSAVAGWSIDDFAPRDDSDAGGHPREREDRAVPAPWR